MSEEITHNLPTIRDLYDDTSLSDAEKNDALMVLLNQQPKKEWVKKHPFITNYYYIPIERIEFLLKSIFKRYRIEITGQGSSFNGVFVTVRVHYLNPVNNEWDYYDGIGACQLQTKKDTSPSDLANINNGAIAMAFPIAKTAAIKDACDHFGKMFGSDLNRKDEIAYRLDASLMPLKPGHPMWVKALEAVKNHTTTIMEIKKKYVVDDETETYLKTL